MTGAEELGGVIIALMALLLIYAWLYFAKGVASLIPTFGIPGLGSLRAGVEALISAGLSVITDWLHAAISPLRAVFDWSVGAIENISGGVQGAVNSLAAIMNYTVKTLIPAVYAQSLNFTIGEFNIAIGLSYTLYNQAIGVVQQYAADGLAHTDAVAGALTSEFTGLFHTAEQDIGTLSVNVFAHIDAVAGALTSEFDGLFNRAEGDIATLGGNLVGYVDSTAATLANQTVKALNAAEAFAETTAIDASAAAIKAVDIDVAAIEAAAWPGVIDAVDGVIGAISTDFPDIRELWQAIPRDIPTTVPLAIAGIGALALPLVKYMEDCGVPICNNLHDFSGIIGALGGLIGDAGLLALLVESVRDPSGTARTVEGLIGGTVHATAGAITSVLGI